MNFFRGLRCLIIPNVLGKSRSQLFESKLKDFGGQCTLFNAKARGHVPLCDYSHVIVDSSLDHEKLLKIIGQCGTCIFVELCRFSPSTDSYSTSTLSLPLPLHPRFN